MSTYDEVRKFCEANEGARKAYCHHCQMQWCWTGAPEFAACTRCGENVGPGGRAKRHATPWTLEAPDARPESISDEKVKAAKAEAPKPSSPAKAAKAPAAEKGFLKKLSGAGKAGKKKKSKS